MTTTRTITRSSLLTLEAYAKVRKSSKPSAMFVEVEGGHPRVYAIAD